VREREALASSPGRKKGTGMAQFRGDDAAAVHGGFGGGSQRAQQWKRRRGEVGKWGGEGARARGSAHFLSEREGEERRSWGGERGALRFETERERGNRGRAVGEGEADMRARLSACERERGRGGSGQLGLGAGRRKRARARGGGFWAKRPK